MGLPVAVTDIATFGDETVLAVERFDVMGLANDGARWLASGHPADGEDLPAGRFGHARRATAGGRAPVLRRVLELVVVRAVDVKAMSGHGCRFLSTCVDR